jgi:hypothetical protein
VRRVADGKESRSMPASGICSPAEILKFEAAIFASTSAISGATLDTSRRNASSPAARTFSAVPFAMTYAICQ